MPNVDLHCHSTASDGSLSPRELLDHAREQGVDVLALTDHDTTAGLASASQAANEAGVRLVPGIEISVSWGGRTLHILGLNIDPDNAALNQGLIRLREFRHWRAKEIARKLDKAGIPGSYDAVCRMSGEQIISRTHFARFLVENGHAKDIKQVFKRYLVSGKPGHVAGKWASLAEAIDWIHGAGGRAVIAHPARYSLSATKLRVLFNEFKEMGGDGLEVACGSQSRRECQRMAQYARQYDLLASCGSDYHGPQHAWLALGRVAPLPTDCTPVWYDWDIM